MTSKSKAVYLQALVTNYGIKQGLRDHIMSLPNTGHRVGVLDSLIAEMAVKLTAAGVLLDDGHVTAAWEPVYLAGYRVGGDGQAGHKLR